MKVTRISFRESTPRRYVVFINNMPLYIKEAVLCDNGKVVQFGYVVNGDWNFEVRNNEWLAKEGNRIVTRWPFDKTTYKHVLVPAHIKGDYNEVIEWAESVKGILCPE